MRRKRRNHSASFKAMVAVAAILVMSGCGGSSSTKPSEPTPTPTEPTPTPTEPTPTPTEPTPTPMEPTPAPMEPTPAPMEPTPAPMDTFYRLGSPPGEPHWANAHGAIVEAVRNTPNAGSVTQSSNAVADITTDSVSVAVTRNVGQRAEIGLLFEVEEVDGWSTGFENEIDPEDTTGLRMDREGWSWYSFLKHFGGGGQWDSLAVHVYVDIEEPNEAPARCGVGSTVSAGSPCIWEAGGQRFTLSIESGSVCFRGGAVYSCVAGGDHDYREATFNGVRVSIMTEGGRITVLSDNLMLVDDTVKDTDYLARGIWVRTPANGNLADYEFGAFVDGNDPFEQSNLTGLTGEATYMGEATAVYSIASTRQTYFPDAKASLTASFGDGATLGTIEGRIYDITGHGPMSDSYDGVVINLGRAAIGASDSGFFTGDTSTTGTDSAFTGKWGGQFYGNGAAATDHPGSVAGTFGTATASGGESFIGMFGAHRQP